MASVLSQIGNVTMARTFVLLFAIVTLSIAKPQSKCNSQRTEYCYSTDENPYLFFSTKTAYDYNHGDLNEDEVAESKFKILGEDKLFEN